LHPLGTVRAPLDAYGSKKIAKKKKESMCRFQFYFFFFYVTGFFNERSSIKKNEMGFGSLPSKKKEITELIKLTYH